MTQHTVTQWPCWALAPCWRLLTVRPCPCSSGWCWGSMTSPPVMGSWCSLQHSGSHIQHMMGEQTTMILPSSACLVTSPSPPPSPPSASPPLCRTMTRGRLLWPGGELSTHLALSLMYFIKWGSPPSQTPSAPPTPSTPPLTSPPPWSVPGRQGRTPAKVTLVDHWLLQKEEEDISQWLELSPLVTAVPRPVLPGSTPGWPPSWGGSRARWGATPAQSHEADSLVNYNITRWTVAVPQSMNCLRLNIKLCIIFTNLYCSMHYEL